MNVITYPLVENHTKQLIQSFLDGEDFALELSEQVLSTFDKYDQTSYIRMLEHIKGSLSAFKKVQIGDIFLMEKAYDLSIKEQAVLVRFINISHKGNKNIIVLNNKVLYIGSEYSKYEDQIVKDHIEKSINELYRQRHTQVLKEKFNRWKKNFFLSLTLRKVTTVN